MIKFSLKLKIDELREMCISHNWFTLGTNENYEDMFNFINLKNQTSIDEYDLLYVSHLIKKFSSTDETLEEIRQSLETILRVSEREVK